jgi:type I restriction enzyme M protein
MAERIDPKPGEILLDPDCGTGGFLTCAIRHMRQHYVKTVEDEQRMQQGLRAVEKKQLPHMLCVTNMRASASSCADEEVIATLTNSV